MSVANDQPIRIRVPHQHNAISRAIDELAREGFATRVTSKPDEPIIQYGDYSEWVLYISPLTGSLTPTHSSPATAGTGTLKLTLVDDPSIYDTAEIEIYGDHLERDITNFLAGKRCAPSIELADGSFVSGVGMGCASSANHALKGTTGSGTYLRTLPIVYDREPWATFATRNLNRGWILELRYGATKESAGFRHWQTVKSAGTGAGQNAAETYAGDTVIIPQKFRHETVEAYYSANGLNITSQRWVIVYDPN